MTDITLFKSLGIAVEDVASARHIYDKAVERVAWAHAVNSWAAPDVTTTERMPIPLEDIRAAARAPQGHSVDPHAAGGASMWMMPRSTSN